MPRYARKVRGASVPVVRAVVSRVAAGPVDNLEQAICLAAVAHHLPATTQAMSSPLLLSVSAHRRRVSALLLAGAFIVAGCGQATGESGRSSTALRSGIAGDAVARTCGGAPASGQGCRNRPVTATVVILRLPSHRAAATVHTDRRGSFRLALRPGSYRLQARTSSQLLWAPVVTARVLSGQVSRVTVLFVPRHPLPVAPKAASG